MRNKFDQQLETLHVELIKMGALCEDAITASITALEKNDMALARKVFETESEIAAAACGNRFKSDFISA